MITTKLYGGLGNQMFQFAAGKALASKEGSKLFLDTSWFDEIKGNADVVQRSYELDGFNIKPARMNIFDRRKHKSNPPLLYREETLNYQAGFGTLSGNVILDGYWQSHKYFENYRDIIIGSFDFSFVKSNSISELMEDIYKSNSVSVHVRRGDYNTARGRDYHGLIDPDYYYAAVKHIAKKTGGLKLFVISDEIEWCKRNLSFDYPVVYVDSNTSRTGVEDMKIMSSCNHNIIANSSFSWWAAWLNTNQNKNVVAPRQWFKAVDAKIEDRIPKEWLII